MVSLPEVTLPSQVWFALAVLLVGLVLGTVVGALNRRILVRLGIPDLIEGTAFERTARDFGTSTVNIIARLSTLFVVGVALLAALSVTRADYTTRFLEAIAAFLPRLFVAAVIVIVGVVVGDKAALLVSERLRAVKVPQVSLVAALAKYTVFYVAGLIALSQVGVVTDALVVLLAAYLFAVVFLGGLAFSDLLSAGAAGVYLLLTQPYGIGDEIRVDDTAGVVQEVDLFVTHVETDGEEHVLPNDRVFAEGFARVR